MQAEVICCRCDAWRIQGASRAEQVLTSTTAFLILTFMALLCASATIYLAILHIDTAVLLRSDTHALGMLNANTRIHDDEAPAPLSLFHPLSR